ncbi:MAG: hypothetical protein IKT99_06875 [Oscillospiraceae bacterium]|nr:hypothetical protein [Oscillospiraceae bacterium]
MREEKHVIVVDPDEHRLMVKGLNEFRTKLNNEGHPLEDINELMVKVIDAPTKRDRWRVTREAK